MNRRKVLLVEDEKLLGRSIRTYLDNDYSCEWAESAEKAMQWLEKNEPAIIVSDIHLPLKSGMDLLEWNRERGIEAPVILMTAHSSIKNAVEAMHLGAADYVAKPVDLEELEFIIRRALKKVALQDEVNWHREQSVKGPGTTPSAPMVCPSGASQEVEMILQRLVDVEARTGEAPSILITGETGTGKTALARRIHQQSPRAKGPFIEFNCAAITETMFESELFGHEKGAFTGANDRRIGLFELAHGGTLFLDEIGHSPAAIQVKLLKAIEDKVVRRVGGGSEINVDVRLVAATNRDINRAVADHEFREDLLHRLSLVRFHLTPLRDRKEDIPALADHFLTESKNKYQLLDPVLTPESLGQLLTWSWPGNLRELKNEIERSVLLYHGSRLDFSYLKGISSGNLTGQSAFMSSNGTVSSGDLQPGQNENINAGLNSNSTNGLSGSNAVAGINTLPANGHAGSSNVAGNHLGGHLNSSLNNGMNGMNGIIGGNSADSANTLIKANAHMQAGLPIALPPEGMDLLALEARVLSQALIQADGDMKEAARLTRNTPQMLRFRLEKFKVDAENLTGWDFILPNDGVRVEELERDFVQQALEQTKGNVSNAARLLNLSRDQMRYRLDKQKA